MFAMSRILLQAKLPTMECMDDLERGGEEMPPRKQIRQKRLELPLV